MVLPVVVIFQSPWCSPSVFKQDFKELMEINDLGQLMGTAVPPAPQWTTPFYTYMTENQYSNYNKFIDLLIKAKYHLAASINFKIVARMTQLQPFSLKLLFIIVAEKFYACAFFAFVCTFGSTVPLVHYSIIGKNTSFYQWLCQCSTFSEIEIRSNFCCLWLYE